MRLSNLPTPTRGYTHFLGRCNLPGKIAEARLKEILPLIRLQNQNAIEEAICGHMRLAMEIVGRYLFVLKHDRWVDDLVGAAMEGLCDAVNNASARLRDDNLTGYIVATIHGRLSRCIDCMPVVRIPRQTRNSRKKAGKSDLPPDPQVLQIDTLSKLKHLNWLVPVSVNSDVKILELKEIIDKVAFSETHRKILGLLEQSYTLDEIAEQLDLAKTSVWLMRQEMQQRYLELTDGLV